jgi:hypothetical protein
LKSPMTKTLCPTTLPVTLGHGETIMQFIPYVGSRCSVRRLGDMLTPQ